MTRYITATFLVISWCLPTAVHSYVEPAWWARIDSEFTGINLKTCWKVVDGIQPPVVTGQGCSNKPKTCYFGNQECPDGTSYPTEECVCSGDVTRSGLGEWTCEDIECPDAVPTTSAPSTSSQPSPSTLKTTLDPSSAPTAIPTTSDPCTICGNVKADTNNDDTGDVNLVGITIRLLDPVTGGVVATTETDASGNYCFEDVPPDSSFFIRQVNDASYPFDVSDIDGGDPNSILKTADECTSIGNDFVDEPGCSICGSVLADIDGDGEPDIPIPASNIGLKDPSGIVVSTTLTDTNGDYCFNFVPPGPYLIFQTNDERFPFDVSDSDGGDPDVIRVDACPSSTNNIFVDTDSGDTPLPIVPVTIIDEDTPIPIVSVSVIDPP